MATTNANDSRPRDNRSREARSNENYKPRTSRDSANAASEQGRREYKPFNREKKSYNYNKDSKSFGVNKDNKVGKTAGSIGKSKDYKSGGYSNSSYNKDKDLDNDNKHGKGYGSGRDQRMGEAKSKAGQNREKEQQPDKFETIKRLEKEKKVMQRKNEEFNRKSERPNRTAVKQRRTNNIDWTRGYANGLYGDDDEDYTEYL